MGTYFFMKMVFALGGFFIHVFLYIGNNEKVFSRICIFAPKLIKKVLLLKAMLWNIYAAILSVFKWFSNSITVDYLFNTRALIKKFELWGGG